MEFCYCYLLAICVCSVISISSASSELLEFRSMPTAAVTDLRLPLPLTVVLQRYEPLKTSLFKVATLLKLLMDFACIWLSFDWARQRLCVLLSIMTEFIFTCVSALNIGTRATNSKEAATMTSGNVRAFRRCRLKIFAECFFIVVRISPFLSL